MEKPEQPAKKRSGAIRRLPLYLLVILIGGPAAYYFSLRNPQVEINRLAAKVESLEPRQVFYRYKGASVGLYPSRGYSLTVYVGDTGRFAPAQFLILSRIDGKAQGELMNTEGAAGVSLLTGGRLEAYLKRCELDVTPIERAYEAWRQQGKPGRKR